MNNKTVKALVIFLFLGQALAAQNGFNGTWLINKDKSEFGKAPSFVIPKQITLEVNADSLKLAFLNVDTAGREQPLVIGIVALDGLATDKVVDNKQSRKAVVKLSPDNRGLTREMNFYLTGNPDESLRTVNETWSLSADGKVMTLLQTVKWTGGMEYEVKGSYDKVK